MVVLVPSVVLGTALGMMAGNLWRNRRRGRELIRLRYRTQGLVTWFSPLYVPLFALMYVAVERLLVGQPPRDEFPWHIFRIVLLFWTAQSFCYVPWTAGRTLALCENGVRFGFVGFTPWHSIAPRAVKLLDNDGNLVIRHGASSIVAIVPPEERGVVEELLTDKLSASNKNSRKNR
jgi:hypothetical protein